MDILAAVPAIPSVNSGYIAFSIVMIAGVIALPLVLAVVVNKRLHVGWRYFWFGALIFFIFQIITRVPLVEIVQVVFAQQLQDSAVLRYGWLAILALTAGLFEEFGRYFGYRWFMGKEPKTWAKGIMYGVGHGGLEAILLVGGLAIVQVINLLLLPSLIPSLPAAQQQTAVNELTQLAAQPVWFPLLGLWERIWAIAFHLAMSVVVLQAFQRGQFRWVWLAVLLHALLDGGSVFLPQLLPFGTVTNDFIVEAYVFIWGIFAIWLIFALRGHDPEAASAAPPVVMPTPAPQG